MSTKNMIQHINEYFATQPVAKAWLFGSYSRGEERTDSDVDILVVFDKDAHVGLIKFSGMKCDLEEILHKNVDLVVEGSLMPFAVESANRDKVLIYESHHWNAQCDCTRLYQYSRRPFVGYCPE